MHSRTRLPRSPRGKHPRWDLCLYVAGQSPRSLLACENLKRFCEKYLAGRCRVKVVDVVAHPEIAGKENIVVLPTLVCKAPNPSRSLIGTLTDAEQVLKCLGVEAPREG